ncbi:MAG: MoaD/ThiS family protein [Rhodospirillales bacterium]|jgi:hypothetical protein|nr:MoaD/ThiS family protein [Rhodospirillales bacterium]MDP6772712.1 MoaD/ThiS family protein [Rhodospirillales bacterium]|tara:strand:- start:388 stop:678 length:291 start_codon:yes stop_codon:yes gene_type:complete
MPKIEIAYAGLIRTLVRSSEEHWDMPSGSTVGQLLEEVVRRHGPATRPHLLNGTAALPPHVLVSVDGVACRDLATPLDGKEARVRILVMSPMMVGG